MSSATPSVHGTFLRLRQLLLTAASFGCVVLTGCIGNHIFQPVKASAPTLYYPPSAPAKLRDNVATVEFDKDGKLFDPCDPKRKFPCQMRFAEMSIEAARHQGDPKKLVVLVFIHGNRNNASMAVDNYPHFLELIECLNVGRSGYEAQLAAEPHGSPFHKVSEIECHVDDPAVTGVRYLGVYLGWRGRTNKPGLDFRQAAAGELAERPDILDVLRRLRNEAKPEHGDGSRVIVVGHSFGGLILERATARLYDGASGGKPYLPFADMLLTINAAVNGHVAKEMIQKFQSNGPGPLPSSTLSAAMSRPLLIAVHSKTDSLTGALGSGARQVIPAYGGDDNGVFDGDKPKSGNPPSKSLIDRSTPANLLYFDNLCYFDGVANNAHSLEGDTVACDDLAQLVKDDPSVRSRFLAFPSLLTTTEQLPFLYRRMEYICRGKKEEEYAGDTRPECGTDESTVLDFTALPWNRSAYWLFNLPDDVIEKHDGFWTPQMVRLITELNRQFPILDRTQVLP